MGVQFLSSFSVFPNASHAGHRRIISRHNIYHIMPNGRTNIVMQLEHASIICTHGQSARNVWGPSCAVTVGTNVSTLRPLHRRRIMPKIVADNQVSCRQLQSPSVCGIVAKLRYSSGYCINRVEAADVLLRTTNLHRHPATLDVCSKIQLSVVVTSP
jgi:hypothetical protein